MNYNKNILDKWLRHRYEELCSTFSKQYYGKIHFDTHLNNILEKVSKDDTKYTKEEIGKIAEEYLEYSSFYMFEFYKQGFKDWLNLVLNCMEGNQYVSYKIPRVIY